MIAARLGVKASKESPGWTYEQCICVARHVPSYILKGDYERGHSKYTPEWMATIENELAERAIFGQDAIPLPPTKTPEPASR